MKKELAVSVLVLGMALSVGSAAAQQSQDSDVEVNVSTVTRLDVRPSQLNYGTGDSQDLEPGDATTTSDNGYNYISISNIGSEEIADITAEATMPSNQTFGATGLDTSEQFNTGNFVTVSTEEAQTADYSSLSNGIASVSNMHYINRVEYAEETPPTYIDTTDNSVGTVGVSDSNPSVGRFRVGGAEYFWVFYGDTGSSNAGVLRIGQSPHTPTELGTTDFTNEGDDYIQWELSSDGSTGNMSRDDTGGEFQALGQQFVEFDVSDNDYEGQPLLNGDGTAKDSTYLSNLTSADVREYNIYADINNDQASEDYILRTTFNTNPVDPSDSSDSNLQGSEVTADAQTPIFSTGNEGDQLQPGQSFPLNIGVEIPLGVAEDRINQGTVTLSASSTT